MKRRAWPWLALAVLLPVFISAGFWQLGRAQEKEAALAQAADLLATREPMPLAVALAADGAAWVRLQGRFLSMPAVRLDNQRHDGRVGIRVYRVFESAEGSRLLVDLGWRALPADRAVPDEPMPTATELMGLLVPPPSAGLALGPPLAEVAPGRGWLAMRLDIEVLSSALNTRLAPKVLRVDPALPLGYARDLDLLPNTLPPEKHRGYALQWFGFAATLVVLAFVLRFRRP